MSVSFADYDGDGYIDAFVANDTTRNFLFHNLGGKRFEEIGEMAGVAEGPMERLSLGWVLISGM